MPALSWMQPRDRGEAARTVLTLSTVAVLVTVLLAPARPHQTGGWLVELAVVFPVAGVVVLSAWLLTRSKREAPLAWAMFPVLTVVAVATLDVVTRDVSTAAQVFLIFPALYGGSQLPRPGAALLAGASVAGDILIAGSMLSARFALIDIVYVGAAIVTSTGLLVHAGERRAALLATLREQAAIDSLTGLATRRVLDQAATRVFRAGDAPLGTALVLLDIDRFKAVNDLQGHVVGDEVLIRLATLLRADARGDDVVSRMGGDEIAMLLPGCSYPDALRRAEEICSFVRRQQFGVPDSADTLRVTVSLGVAHTPTHADDPRSLYAAADASLYDAKRSGRDRVGAVPVLTSVLDTDKLAEPA